MNLNKLLIIHTIITFAATCMLLFAPAIIPKTVNITLAPNQYLLCYFLAAAELAIAYLSFKATKISNHKALHIIIETIIIFHLSTAAFELTAMFGGTSKLILINVAARILVSILFYIYGTKRLIEQTK